MSDRVDWERTRRRLRAINDRPDLLASFDEAQARGEITQRLIDRLYAEGIALRDFVVIGGR